MADRDVEALTKPLKIGSATGRTSIATNGRQTFESGAKVIKIIPVLFIGASVSPPASSVAYDYNENCLSFEPGGDISQSTDRIIAHFIEYPQEGEIGNGLIPVLRFKQTNANNSEFKIQYRIQPDGGGPLVTAWTLLTADVTNDGVYTYVSGSIIQKIKFPTISLVGAGDYPTIDLRLARSDANVGNICVNAAYMEYVMDKLGK